MAFRAAGARNDFEPGELDVSRFGCRALNLWKGCQPCVPEMLLCMDDFAGQLQDFMWFR